MVLTALVFIVTTIAVVWTAQMFAEDIIEQWVSRFIVKQALYDKNRTLQPILRELALAKQLAASKTIKLWAKKPDDEKLKQGALDELENYRANFQDKSYFAALLSNGHYYHNNSLNEFRGKEFRYTLNPNNQDDSWFYNLINQKRDIHINVNPDVNLRIVKLWIDVLIRDGSDILGIIGTGLDLTNLLNNVIEDSEPGIHNIFVDHSGAIQLHRDKELIDYGSVSKAVGSHKTIDIIFQDNKDKVAIFNAMKELESGNKQIATIFVNLQGKRNLVGLVYLPEIDWYEITLMDLNTYLPISHFFKIISMFVTTLLITLILMNYALNKLVLKPISKLDTAMGVFENGRNPMNEIGFNGNGEIGRAINHFVHMAETVIEIRRDLEQKVYDRTVDLERLAQRDPLTELYNRRGMTEKSEENLNRAHRENNSVGLLLIDIDWFKQINDTYGHSAGDEALKIVAKVIKETLRSYDLAARWGGDEFLILLSPIDAENLSMITERLRSRVEKHAYSLAELPLSISIGCALSDNIQSLDTLLKFADQALYTAKSKGRNCFHVYQC